MASNFQDEQQISLDFGGSIPTLIRNKWKWLVAIAGVAIGAVLLKVFVSFYTDWLWFSGLDVLDVYVTILLTKVVLLVVSSLVFGIIAGSSYYVAYRLTEGDGEHPLLVGSENDVLRRITFWGTVAIGVVLSVSFGIMAAGNWELFLRFWSAVEFGETDPVFAKDVSFYAFGLPLYDFVQGWLFKALIVVLASTLVIYFIRFSIKGVGFNLTQGLKIHISAILGILFLTLAAGHWLDRWSLVFSDQGVVFGATYADIYARKPALLILTIVATSCAALMFVNAYLKGVRLAVGAVGLWVVLMVVFQVAWPRTVQRLTVNPNEFAKEREFISRNIDFTRKGYGLNDMTVKPYPVTGTLSAELIADNLKTVDNIRLWDHTQLSDVYRQIQLIRPYYDFKDADVDRYTVDGEYRQVMLAPREIAQDKLDDAAQTWINTKLRFTHGFGIAMSPVTEFTQEGRPEFFAKDIPNDGVIRIQSTEMIGEASILITNPRIYYGEKGISHVIVNTKTEELDYQAEGGELKSNRYDGSGGVVLSSFVRRMAYALQFRDINILITGEVEKHSRIQYRREIQERISKVAPFLRLDEDPYIVASDGRLFWIQDAYTVTDRYPYSEPVGEGFNYIRNSVKIVVDAYNGTIRFYVVDSNDAIVRTYMEIFPDLFDDIDDMSTDLRAHIRYPQDLFGYQADRYLRYHMLDPQDFYNLEDIWSIPEEKFGQGAELQPVDPYYVIMKIPGEENEEFVLLTPYTRNDPPILAGWLAARNDGAKYGELVAFTFPKERQVDSPQQIEAKIDNDPTISEWFTLRCQEGSFCIRGNLLVIPVASGDEFGLLYAEPVYLQAEGIQFPELKRVILATGDRVVMESSVPEAIAALVGYSRPAIRQVGASDEGLADQDEKLRKEMKMLSEALEVIKREISNLEELINRLSDTAGGK